jgi:hypothetical protein
MSLKGPNPEHRRLYAQRMKSTCSIIMGGRRAPLFKGSRTRQPHCSR